MILEIPQHFIFDRGEVELLTISGPDRSDFLNRLSTVNFKKPFAGSLYGAFLNGQAKLISIFTTWETSEKNYFFIEKEMFLETKKYLELMHFTENLKIETEKYFCIEVRSQDAEFLAQITIEAYDWGLPGKYFFSQQKMKVGSTVKTINQSDYDIVRADFGFPKPYRDLTQDHILIEASLDKMIDRNKGCYPGQEIIEKIYTYGRLPRKIKKLIFENASQAEIQSLQSQLPLEIKDGETKVGTLTSAYFMDSSGHKNFGMATLKRLFYEKHQTLKIPFQGQMLYARIAESD